MESILTSIKKLLGIEEFYEDPVYLWPILKSLEKQINAIEYK